MLGLLSPLERLLLDEAGPVASALVLDAPALAAHLAGEGASVAAFCDLADDQASLATPVEVVEPGAFGEFERALVRLPKSLDALDEYAGWAVQAGAEHLLVGARVKDLTRQATTVLERHFRTVRASLGRDKARVLHASDPIAHPAGWRPGWPRTRTITLPDGGDLVVTHHGSTFASGRLDAATRLLLEQLPGLLEGRSPSRVLDWGSGAGILATWLAGRLPDAEVIAVDSSWAAAASTAATASSAGVRVSTHWVDGVRWLSEMPDSSLDLVVSNPPFHQGVAKDSGPTLQMFAEGARALAPGGRLALVHNSHLPWARVLCDLRVGQVSRLAQDRQFTVTSLTR
ncbi:class I SAM-dependent methyltransferase [Aestuariimicrobium ganziense]|uniref:class I SAM-dependent methyltransferase n=1 Tax=Aestuariimicrobium ganziense TaxID=2773677 RepID=UPI0019421C48|nr:methyltransferase [Aestuariimicrobium ganziense]